MRTKRFNMTTRLVVIAVTLLVLFNAALGAVLLKRSAELLKDNIQARMLDVANSAAAMMDGDVLGRLQAEDVDTEEYQACLRLLRVFLNHIDLSYIYGIRAVGDREFVFTIDPEEVSPGAFGEPIAYTDALYAASLGTPSVDEEPYLDRWGSFYSAYSPVFDSEGKVAGIIGVDFAAEWLDQQVASLMRSTAVLSGVSLLAGALLVVLVTERLRRRLKGLYGQLNGLADNVEALLQEIKTPPGFAPELAPETAQKPEGRSGDEIDRLSQKIAGMQEELRAHIELAHARAYLDVMTGVGNKSSYLDFISRLEKTEADREERYAVAVFDLNGLKTINDNSGHESGDEAILDAAGALKSVYGAAGIFRVGGDEFIAVVKEADAAKMEESFGKLEAALAEINERPRSYRVPLTLSKGCAVYDRARDASYKEVFKRADEAMYRDKAAFYARSGDRRRRG